MDLAEQYKELKERASKAEGQRQFWEGKKEAQEASKKSLLAEANSLGYEGSDIQEILNQVKTKLASDLDELEVKVSDAESQFLSLRSKYVTKT